MLWYDLFENKNLLNNQNYMISRKLKIKFFLDDFVGEDTNILRILMKIIFKIISKIVLSFYNREKEFWIFLFYHIFIVILFYTLFFIIIFPYPLIRISFILYIFFYLFFSFNLISAIQKYNMTNVLIVGFRWKVWNKYINHSYISKLVPYIQEKTYNRDGLKGIKIRWLYDFFNHILSFFISKLITFIGLYKMILHWTLSHTIVFWGIYIWGLFYK